MNTTAARFEPVSTDAFRAAFERVFAQAPASADERAPLRVDILQSPVGTLMLMATPSALCGLEFIDMDSVESRLHSVRRRIPGAVELGPNDIVERTNRQLNEYFAGRRTGFDLPVSYSGTAFQEKVWSALLKIDYGKTWSYLDLALSVGDRGATRAVGLANGANPVAIVIPCHRVVNANGELGGYGGGLWRKRILLDLEKGQTQLLF